MPSASVSAICVPAVSPSCASGVSKMLCATAHAASTEKPTACVVSSVLLLGVATEMLSEDALGRAARSVLVGDDELGEVGPPVATAREEPEELRLGAGTSA